MSTKHTKHQIIFVKKGLLEIRLKIRLNRHKGEAATRGVLCKMVFSEISQNSQENTGARVPFLTKLQACNFIKKETLVQVFSYEFCKSSENIFFTEHLWTTASDKGCQPHFTENFLQDILPPESSK